MINKSRLVKLTQKVLSIDSQNPPGNEAAIGRFVASDMRSLGLEVRVKEFVKGRTNVIATLKGTWPRAKASREAVLLTPHIDVVPVGTGWKFPPLSGRIVGDKIYGRGASDDKGNLACAMEVMRSLVEDGVRLKRDLIMAATADEETGSKQGILPLLQHKILQPKVAVVLDSDDFDLVVAQKGLFHIRVQVFGKKAHGAYNWRGVNAIEQAAQIINGLKAHKFTFKKHPLLRPPTVNIGVIKGGDKVNIVADFCEFAVDIRFLPGMTAKQILADVRRIASKVTKKFKIVIDDLQQPYEISQNHPAVRAYFNANKKMRIPAVLKGSEGATVITFFQKHGIPAFATGYGAGGTAHTTDEYAQVSTLVKGAQVLEKFLIHYAA